jgi:hypothetical protein
MQALRDAAYEVLQSQHPASVRGVFYLLYVRGLVEKREYQAVVRLLTLMRREGSLPYEWITDATRYMHKTRSYPSMEFALQETARLYRRMVWNDLPLRVEVWCESRAIIGVLFEETDLWDVPLMPVGGFSSVTFLESSGRAIRESGKETYCYYFGDHDPSGLSIGQKIEQDVRQHAGEVPVHFERMAVTPEQIRAWGLPSKPANPNDSRTRRFEGDTVELDAIPPSQLRHLVRECITRHVDGRTLAEVQRREEDERETLRAIADQVAGWGRPA